MTTAVTISPSPIRSLLFWLEATREFIAICFAPIKCLLPPCRPSAICGLIVPVIVDSIDRLSIRPVSHISKEIRESFPAIAHRYPPATVVLERSVIRVMAALHHVVPREVERLSLSGLPASDVFPSGRGFTSAREHRAGSEMNDDLLVPAGASTKPAGWPVRVLGNPADCSQLPVDLSGMNGGAGSVHTSILPSN